MSPLVDLLGESPGIVAVRQKVGQLLQHQMDARRLPPILIQGETGTGKGLLAHGIHQAGPRRAGPFVDVNCAAIPETLLEAEMFGFERGAFTDARQAKVGLFQAAHRGTIFLDEVGLLPEPLQAKLLKVLEEQAVRRLGSTRSEPVDVWILAATSENLAVAARDRRFREDLYHRLAVLTLWLPPLRERGPDILFLAEHFLARVCADYHLPPKEFDAIARSALLAYRWPGNIRELANVIERVALLSEGSLVTADVLGLPETPRAELTDIALEETTVPLDDVVGSVEREHLLQALRQTNWNISRAAALLGISRNTLRYRIEKHALRPGVSPPPRRRVERSPVARPTAPAAVPPEVGPPAPVRWERRRLTLLRADLVPPSQERSPVDSSRQLEVLVDKVKSFGGRIEELSPTGIVAAFGIEPIEDAPRRAALSALAMQKSAEHSRRSDAEPLGIKIAIHVGHFLVGQADGAAKIDLDGKRQAWMVLEGLVVRSEPNSIVTAEDAAPFLERSFDLVALGVLEPLAGRAYRLAGRERAGLGPGGPMTRFVGRGHELELLHGQLAAAMRGQGQVVGITGEPGIGKSRLVFEFRQGLEGKRVRYLEGRCVSYGSTTPYLPVLDILRMCFGIADPDSPETIAGKVRAGLADAGMNPAEGLLYLLHLLGIKEETDPRARLSPEVIKGRVFETIRQAILRWSQRHPLVIAVKDLHWIDGISEECFSSLAEVVAGAPILLISTYRPGYRPRWLEKSYATQIALQPLASHDSVSVLQSVLGTPDIPESLVELILSKAEGNPFFLEELARSVREAGGLATPRAVPDTIEEVILARLDRLPAEGKRLLQAAAVIGKDVPLSLVRVIADLPDDELRRALMHLQAAEFLYERSVGEEPEYTFKHALTQEVAYGSLLQEWRRDLHTQIVEAIERLYSERLGEHVDRLAHHAFRGGLWAKALTYLRQAGSNAASRSAHREAVACFEQALVALGHLPSSRDTIERAIDLRFDLRNSLHPLGELGRILDHLREAQELAETLDDQRRLGQVFTYMTQYFRLMGDLDRAIESGHSALAIAQRLENFLLQVATNTNLGPAYGDRGDYRTAIEILRGNIESLPGEVIGEPFGLAGLPSVFSRIYLVGCLAEVGEFSEGLPHGEEGIRIAEAVDHPYSLTFAYFGLGSLLLLKGEIQRAIPALERSLELCRTLNFKLTFPLPASSLGSAYAISGRLADALPLLEQAVEQADSMKRMGGHSLLLARLGEGYLLLGRQDDAMALARRALQLSRAQKERGYQAYALRLLGDVTAHGKSPDVEKAEAPYREAIAIAEELGMRPLLAHCHAGLATLYGRAGKRADAEQHTTFATALFREMDMRFWLEPD